MPGVGDGERGTQVAPLRFIFVRVIIFLSVTRGEGRIHDISEVCLAKQSVFVLYYSKVIAIYVLTVYMVDELATLLPLK